MRIDHIAHQSELKKIEGKYKLILMVILLMIIFLGKNVWINGCIGLCLTVILKVFGKTALKDIAKFLMIPLSFILMNVISFAFDVTAGFNLHFSRPGLWLGLYTGFNAMMSMIAVVFVLATTPLTQLLETFEALKIPRVVIDIMRLSYPMIFIGYDILYQTRRAQKSRLGYSRLTRAYYSVGYLGARLFQRLHQHGIELYRSMLSRGYGKEI